MHERCLPCKSTNQVSNEGNLLLGERGGLLACCLLPRASSDGKEIGTTD